MESGSYHYYKRTTKFYHVTQDLYDEVCMMTIVPLILKKNLKIIRFLISYLNKNTDLIWQRKHNSLLDK